MGKVKDRKRSLEKKRGTTAHDPFIPARNAQPKFIATPPVMPQKLRASTQLNRRRILLFCIGIVLYATSITFLFHSEWDVLWSLFPFPPTVTKNVVFIVWLLLGTVALSLAFAYRDRKMNR